MTQDQAQSKCGHTAALHMMNLGVPSSFAKVAEHKNAASVEASQANLTGDKVRNRKGC